MKIPDEIRCVKCGKLLGKSKFIGKEIRGRLASTNFEADGDKRSLYEFTENADVDITKPVYFIELKCKCGYNPNTIE